MFSREVRPYSVPVTPESLKEGSEYYILAFVDSAMLIPEITTVCYIGKNLDQESDGEDVYYFQHIDAYNRGVTIDSTNEDGGVWFYRCSTNNMNGIFEFDKLLDELLSCSVRRAGT